MAESENDVLTSAEAASALGIDRFRLSRLVRRGVIEPLPFDPLLTHPRYRFTRAEIQRVVHLREQREREWHERASSGNHRIPQAS